MYRLLSVFALLLSLLSPEMALAGSTLKVEKSTPWTEIGPNTWTKTLVWQSGLHETITVTNEAGVLRFVAQSTCAYKSDRVVTYVWTHNQQHAEGLGCSAVTQRIPVRMWEEAIKDNPFF